MTYYKGASSPLFSIGVIPRSISCKDIKQTRRYYYSYRTCCIIVSIYIN